MYACTHITCLCACMHTFTWVSGVRATFSLVLYCQQTSLYLLMIAKKVTEQYLINQRNCGELGFHPLPNVYRPCKLGKKSRVFKGFPACVLFKAGIVLQVHIPHADGTWLAHFPIESPAGLGAKALYFPLKSLLESADLWE